MFDEREWIARFEGSDAEELIQLLDRPSRGEEKALRAHLGDHLYQRMHGLALRCRIQRDRERPRGNVVVIPGFLGSELCLNGADPAHDGRLWLNIHRIMEGDLQRLRLSEDGLRGLHPEDEIHVGGLIKRQYGELLLTLAGHWDVRGFAYDWRKDIEQTSGVLLAKIDDWFGVDEPVHLVTHGMGGLVARAFIRNHRLRWKSMRKTKENARSGGRLVMLGSPNQGSFLAVRALTGLAEIVQGLTMIDKHHDLTDLLKVVQSFVSIYQMLPAPVLDKKLIALFRSDTYGDLHVSKRHLKKAREDQNHLADAVDLERMVQVFGYGYPTVEGIKQIDKISTNAGYRYTSSGDGSVAIETGRLRSSNGEPARIPTFYLHENQSGMACSAKILSTIDELLESGTTSGLEREVPPDLDTIENPPQATLLLDGDSGPLTISPVAKVAVNHLHTRGSADNTRIYPEERTLSDVLVRGLTVPVSRTPARSKAVKLTPIPRIEFQVISGRVTMLDYDAYLTNDGKHPIDAIAVGHYLGVKPEGQELELDDAISRAHLARLGVKKHQLDEVDRILTQYSERGIIRGELGQPFFLDDPRSSRPGGRMIAIAGMGLPGRFGVPELTVLARELVWSVGRLGRRHLCAAPIGTKNGNLTIEDAMSGWVRGIKAAITGSDQSELHHVMKISFVANDPRKIERYNHAIIKEQHRLKKLDRLEIVYEGFSKAELDQFNKEGYERDLAEFEAAHKVGKPDAPPVILTPTRVTIGIERKVFRFGAITENASISERTVPIDPDLVEEANKELAAESDPDLQLERGRLLEGLVIPKDLRPMMALPAPLVMMMDATAARIHWEMVATSDPFPASHDTPQTRPAIGGALSHFEFGNYFFGTSRGFTRQLRSAFAPPPEPPPPPRRILRVLVVADPAEDARLPGAETEGVEVADLFESYNTIHGSSNKNRIEVVRLIGPREATRTNVLRELMIRSYDVLHFAGHCAYDEAEPKSSGWIFTGNQRLSAAELTRIDRVPKFIFSNACESGITPDRADERNAHLAPTFAEAFFERGVSNFVCTAWPVDDGAARLFALNLYAQLLGLRQAEDGSNHYEVEPPALMVDAMKEARLAIAPLDEGIRTWGAYQHYGNPYFRFFAATPTPNEATTEAESPPKAEPPVPAARPRRKKPVR